MVALDVEGRRHVPGDVGRRQPGLSLGSYRVCNPGYSACSQAIALSDVSNTRSSMPRPSAYIENSRPIP